MKKIIILTAIFISATAYAQKKDSVLNIDTSGNLRFSIDTTKRPLLLSSNTAEFKVISEGWEIIVIKSNGDLYYRPSFFCDCDKCKAPLIGLKFLKNIYNNSIEQ